MNQLSKKMLKYNFVYFGISEVFLKKTLILTLFLFSFSFAKINIAVSVLPQKFFVDKIAGDLANVEVMVKPGASPATYEVKPAQLKALKEAKVYFYIGVPFEKAWLNRFKSVNEKLLFVDSGKYVKRVPMHSHSDEKKRKSGEFLDPHIWLSPPLVMLQARAVLETLLKVDSKNSKIYMKNYRDFISSLSSIDVKIFSILKNLKQKEFIVFHPSFGYFALSYGLRQIAIEKEGKEPSLRYIKKVVDFAKKRGIKRIFVEPQFSKRSAEYIAKQIGGKVVEIDPLSYEWDKNILKVAEAFANDN